MIKKLMLAVAAAAMLVAVALPAFAQVDLLNPTAFNVGEQNATQEQTNTQEQNCLNIFSQENNQSANIDQSGSTVVGGNQTATIAQEQTASNVAIGVKQENKCVAIQAPEQEQELDQEQEAAAFNVIDLGGLLGG